MADDKDSKRIRYNRIILLLLIAYTAIMLVLSIPRIPQILDMYRVKEHIDLYLMGDEMETGTFTVVLSTASGYAESERSIERIGRDDLHLAIEALLLDESEVELASGMISYIPEGTRLRGISASEGYIFVDLSKEMKGADSRAFEEIRRTLVNLEGPVSVSFLIEGRPVSV